MNYLQLCQYVVQEGGINRNNTATPLPTTVVSQVGEMQRIVQWVDQAWMRVQRKHQDWGWMRQTATFPTVSLQQEYAIGTGGGTVGVSTANFGAWVRDSFRNYNTVAGTNSEVFMDYIPYDDWRNNYLYGALRQSPSRPIQYSIAPDKGIVTGPLSDGKYTVIGDYFLAPSHLAADADVPTGLPAHFHEIIAWGALMRYGAYESAQEVYSDAKDRYDELMASLSADRLPDVMFGGALA